MQSAIDEVIEQAAVTLQCPQKNIRLIWSGQTARSQIRPQTEYPRYSVQQSTGPRPRSEQAASSRNNRVNSNFEPKREERARCPALSFPDIFSHTGSHWFESGSLHQNADIQELETKAWTAQAILYGHLAEQFGKASACVGCGQCEKICLQHLPNIHWLNQVLKRFEGSIS